MYGAQTERTRRAPYVGTGICGSVRCVEPMRACFGVVVDLVGLEIKWEIQKGTDVFRVVQ